MWITRDRVFYRGLLGHPARRVKGAWLFYLAREGPVRLALGDGAWTSGALAAVPPYQAHRVECADRTINVLMVEPESIAAGAMPGWAQGGVVDDPAALQRMRAGCERLFATGRAPASGSAGFDGLFFGAALEPRCLDARVRRVVDRICADPSLTDGAEVHAAACGLSYSRFLHLFAQQCGVSFRTYRAWRRARALLYHVHGELNLTHLALQIGYPDATHFSHSIRHVYGLKPRDIIAGSRRLVVFGAAP